MPGNRQLYKAEVPGKREVILCEGPADAESYRQLGFTAWALCGLGHIPETDLNKLKQRPVVYLSLDGDDEGQKSQEKLAPTLGALTMLVPPFDQHKDANAFLQERNDSTAMLTQLKASTPWIDNRLKAIRSATPHELQQMTSEVLALLKELPKELAPRYLRKTERALGMSRKELRALMAGIQNDDGEMPIHSRIKDGRLTFLGDALGNFAPRITYEVAIIDGMNIPTVHYTVEGRLATGEIMPTVEVEASEFSDMKWIHRYWGARPILYVPRGKYYLFTRAVQETSLDNMIREQVYTYTGWAEINGQRSFLSSTGRITADGFDDSIRVELDENLQHYALPAPPTDKVVLAAAVQASIDFLTLGPLHVTAPIWAAIYAGPLSEVQPLYTVLWIYGTTQTGKTTITHLALSHMGSGFIQGRQYHAPVDWMSTVMHIEESMFAIKDAAIIIDDFAPQFQSAADSRRMHQYAQRVVRMVGNRASRGRSRSYQKKTLIPRGVVLSTAELPLAGESTVGRMIYVPIARGEVLPGSGEPLRPALNTAQQQAQQGVYAQAMSAYIQWLAANWEKAKAQYLATIERSSCEVRESSDLQNRLPDYYATLDAAQELALTAFHDMGVLSQHDADTLAEKNRKAILQVIESQAERIAAESPIRKFFEALSNLLERKKVYLAPRTQKIVFAPPPDADLIGYYDHGEDGLIYLNDYSCLPHVRAFWNTLGENFDTTKDALRRQFNQVPGLIHKQDGSKITASVWTGDKTQRLLIIDAKKVSALFGVVLVEKVNDIPK